MKIIQQVDTGSGHGIDRLVVESDDGELRIEILYAEGGFEVRSLETQRFVIKPIASNAVGLIGLTKGKRA